MRPELEDILQHHGVKGMHWGKHVKSAQREHAWKKASKNANNMSTKDIQKQASRAQLENDMKRISKKRGVGSKKDKQDYLNRANMSDQELFRKVQRLRAKENLNRTANDATKSQKELAKKVIQIAAPLAIQYAITKSVGKGDFVNAAMAGVLVGEKGKMINNLLNQVKQAKKMKHGIEDEETLQHHGVKGMHWGVRKQIKQVVKAHRAAQRAKLDKYHAAKSDHAGYQILYKRRLARNGGNHHAAIRDARDTLRKRRTQNAIIAGKLAVGVAGLASPYLKPHVKKAANAAAKAARNPDNIRKAKNVVQAMKRSPIRYVDGKKMTNVVGNIF